MLVAVDTRIMLGLTQSNSIYSPCPSSLRVLAKFRVAVSIFDSVRPDRYSFYITRPTVGMNTIL